MKRIVIVGSGGAGKSTLARTLGEMMDIQVFHLDRMFWKSGWVSITMDELKTKIQEIISLESWIIDGNYSSSMEMRFQAADAIIFLDYPVWTCLWGIVERRIKYKGRTRPDITEGCDEKLDWEFIRWVLTFPFKRRGGIYKNIEKYSRDKQIIILKSRKQANEFIGAMKEKMESGY